MNLGFCRWLASRSKRVAALRRAGFTPIDTGLTWRASHRAGLDGTALLVSLRAEGVPVGEIRIRAPGLDAIYREALDRAGPDRPMPLCTGHEA